MHAGDVDAVPDLRPSPWRAHLVILGVLAMLFTGFAISEWPSPGSNNLSHNLSALVVVVYGFALGGFAAIATALLAITRSLLRAYLGAIVITGVVIGAIVLAP